MSNDTSTNSSQPANSNSGGPAPLKQLEQLTPVSERHQTELEKWVTHTLAHSQEILNEQGNKLMMWISLILLLLAAIIFYNRTSQAGNESSWLSMFMADTPAKYKEVAETSNDSVVGALASVKQGDSLLFSATENMFKDRETSKTDLVDAKKSYEFALNSPHVLDEVRQRAELGLATIIELQSSDDFSTAIKAYEAVAAKFPDTAVGNIAADRVKLFKDNQDVVAFYKWFSQQNPKPPVRVEPKDQSSSVPISPDLPGTSGILNSSSIPGSTELIPSLKDNPDSVTPDFLKSIEKMPKVEGKIDRPAEQTPTETKELTPPTETPAPEKTSVEPAKTTDPTQNTNKSP